MSASLVGSEMCIRDRRNCLLGPPPVQQNGNGGHGCADVLREATPRSVSYTHLTLPTICSV
eukprot:10362779-Alexandrium_andersonii.AAC.1